MSIALFCGPGSGPPVRSRPNLKFSAWLCSVALLLTGLTHSRAADFQLSIRVPHTNEIRLAWPDQGSNFVYTVQSTPKLPAARWTPPQPWDQWPTSGLSFEAPVITGSNQFFRVEKIQRGRVVSAQLQQTYTVSQIQLILAFSGYDIHVTPRYAIDVYRIEYETVDPLLGSTLATGALAVPQNVGAAVPLLSYQHGTMFNRAEAPSSTTSTERYIGVVLASSGYVVALPDYLGLGPGSTGLHPYAYRRAAATAVIDMLRASRKTLAGLTGITLSPKLFLTGYSQGGQATLAAQQEIEAKHTNEFVITASAPMEGAYDLSTTMANRLVAPTAYSNPEYLPYVLFAFNSVYGLFQNPSEVLLPPYDQTLPPLLDGAHSGSDVANAMPASHIAREILRPEFLTAFNNDPNHPFRRALRESDLLGWRPLSPTRLIHCTADPTVPVANAQAAYDSFIAAGASPAVVQIVDPFPSGNHSTCFEHAGNAMLSWFESLR